MNQQSLLPLGEEETSPAAPIRAQKAPTRGWRFDEKTRRAALKGIEDARRALAKSSPTADAA